MGRFAGLWLWAGHLWGAPWGAWIKTAARAGISSSTSGFEEDARTMMEKGTLKGPKRQEAHVQKRPAGSIWPA